MTIADELRQVADPGKAKTLAWFFKTGKGQYGEGDRFLGVVVPEIRRIARRHVDASFGDIGELLASPYHEDRLAGLIILVYAFDTASSKKKKDIYDFYLAHTDKINNWDLVDLSAPAIIGGYLVGKDKRILLSLAHSDSLWERRIAILSTFADIKQGDPQMTFTVAGILLHDREDLIHKAVGWMLREVGKRCSQKQEEEFLLPRYATMPRTMLRYAIERFDPKRREFYLKMPDASPSSKKGELIGGGRRFRI